MEKNYPIVSEKCWEDIKYCKTYMRNLMIRKNCAPMMIGFAFHSALVFDYMKKVGGIFRTWALQEDLDYKSWLGFDLAFTTLESFQSMFPRLSLADVYQLAGVVAVEVTGGPEVPFHPGRTDEPDQPGPPAFCDLNYCGYLKHAAGVEMCLSDQDTVALSGGRALGRHHKERSGFEKAGSASPLIFDNSYFKELLSAEKEGRLQLPSDKALVSDPAFRPFIEKYAADKDAFCKDYAIAHMKLSELGFADA